MIFLYLCALLLSGAITVDCLNCYVCGQDNEEKINDSCTQFSNSKNKSIFSKECPTNFHTCVSETKGNIIQNMYCEHGRIKDCKILNGIKYCYCTTDLCNEIMYTETSNLNNDDEDLNEGSGYENTVVTTTASNLDQETTLKSLNTGNCLHGALFIVTAALLFG